MWRKCHDSPVREESRIQAGERERQNFVARELGNSGGLDFVRGRAWWDRWVGLEETSGPHRPCQAEIASKSDWRPIRLARNPYALKVFWHLKQKRNDGWRKESIQFSTFSFPSKKFATSTHETDVILAQMNDCNSNSDGRCCTSKLWTDCGYNVIQILRNLFSAWRQLKVMISSL